MHYDRLVQRQRKLHLTPQDLLEDAVGYFNWAADTPLKEEHLFSYQGSVVRGDSDKCRPFSKRALALHIGIPVSRLETYRGKGEEWAEVVEMIEEVIFTQKFENAAAGLLNATIISRDLGLADKSEITGANGKPLEQIVQYQLPSNGRDPVEDE